LQGEALAQGDDMTRDNEHRFLKFARVASDQAGRPWAFTLAAGLVVACVTGVSFRFSDTWQVVMNTISSVVTFLMVFLIQNTQNRDSLALRLKLDELIKASDARNDVIGAEEKPERELKSKLHEVRKE
jgi:low affinity Fe/Cu permease